MSQLQIQILCGPQSGRTHKLTESPVTFGRGPGNDLIVPERTVSRQHGQLEQRDGVWASRSTVV